MIAPLMTVIRMRMRGCDGNYNSKIFLHDHLRGSTTLNSLIFQLCFIILKMKLYVCRNLCENFREIGRKMKKL